MPTQLKITPIHMYLKNKETGEVLMECNIKDTEMILETERQEQQNEEIRVLWE